MCPLEIRFNFVTHLWIIWRKNDLNIGQKIILTGVHKLVNGNQIPDVHYAERMNKKKRKERKMNVIDINNRM